jgi:hypothetical protein
MVFQDKGDNMSIRTLFCILVIITATGDCYADDFWPLDISCYLVSRYIQQKQDVNIDDLQAEYDHVLTFLEQAMLAYKTNIGNYYTGDSLIKHVPAFENGKLVINEVGDTILLVTDQEVRERVNIGLVQ